MKIRALGFALSAGFVAVLAAGALCAQSLSDLDVSGMESAGPAGTTKEQTQTHTNPFASGVSTAEDLAIEDLQLTVIVYQDDNNAYALVSGYLVRPGDRIAGYRVDKIEKDKVRLRRLDEVIVLALGGGI